MQQENRLRQITFCLPRQRRGDFQWLGPLTDRKAYPLVGLVDIYILSYIRTKNDSTIYMVKRIFWNIFFIAMLLFSPGCATLYNSATGKNEFIFINNQTESAIGKNVAAEITKEHTLFTEKKLVDKVQAVGRRLSAVSDRKDIEYKFYILADNELNAVSLPGGFIYINKGLTQILSDDELAFVLGHEIGHVAARHAVKKIQSNMAYQLILSIAFAGAGDKTSSNITDIRKAANMAYNLIELGYSREDEYESDRLGVKYAFKAGFNPDASLSSLEKLKNNQIQESKILVYLRTHPYVDDRINALKKFIPELNAYKN